MRSKTVSVELNRVEGDVAVKLRVEDGVIVDAWCSASTYRGYEQVLIGRSVEDALVITPRICGICSTSQLYAATTAIEVAAGCAIAPDATRLRNLCLMAEAVMNDARHTFLMFVPDLCNHAYAAHPLYPAIMTAFEPPFRGLLPRAAVEQSKRMLGVVIAFGGQWPHSTYMLPGGVTCPITRDRLVDCLDIVDGYQRWYEADVLGCGLERWLEVTSAGELEAWLDERSEHAGGALGLFTRFGRSLGLHRIGRGADVLMSGGCFLDPDGWQPPFSARRTLLAGGVYDVSRRARAPFDEGAITEDVRRSWFADTGAPRHPSRGETRPCYEPGGDRYSWSKAPRYGGQVVEVGPLADLAASGDPLILGLLNDEGPSAWLRQLARLHRPVRVLDLMRRTLEEMLAREGWDTYVPAGKIGDGEGAGIVNAARGPLGHWLSVRDGAIARYQVITPTTWNASPRDAEGRRGHWEQSFIGLAIRDLENPVELGHVVRSHDPCLVCTVHFLDHEIEHRYGAA